MTTNITLKKNMARLAITLSVVMLAACTTEDTVMQDKPNDAMLFTATVKGYDGESVTRTTDVNTFATGDIIFVDKYTNGTSGSRYATPKPYRFGGQYFEAINSTIQNGTTGTWSWELWQEKVYAFKRGDGGGTLQTEFSVKSDQSSLENTEETQGLGEYSGTTGYLNSDFLFSTEKTINFGDGPVGTLSNFQHMVSRVIVKVADNATVSDAEGSCAFDASKLEYATIGDSILMMTGTVSSAGVLTAKTGTGGSIRMYPRKNGSGVITQFECFVIPQTITASEKKFIKLRYNGKTYIYTQSRDITFSAGQSHTITITSLHTDAVEVPLMYTTLTNEHIGYVMCSDGTCYRTAAIAVQNGYAAGRVATNEDKGQVLGMVAYLTQEYSFTDQDNVQVSKGYVIALQDAGTIAEWHQNFTQTHTTDSITDINGYTGKGTTNAGWHAGAFHRDQTITLPKKPAGTYWSGGNWLTWRAICDAGKSLASPIKLKAGTDDETENPGSVNGWGAIHYLLQDRCSGDYNGTSYFTYMGGNTTPSGNSSYANAISNEPKVKNGFQRFDLGHLDEAETYSQANTDGGIRAILFF